MMNYFRLLLIAGCLTCANRVIAQTAQTDAQAVPVYEQPLPADAQPVPADTQEESVEEPFAFDEPQPVSDEAQPVSAEMQPAPTAAHPVAGDAQPIPAETPPVAAEVQQSPAQTPSVAAEAHPVQQDHVANNRADLLSILKTTRETNPQLKSAQEIVEQAQQDISEAESSFKPKVALSRDHGRRRTDNQSDEWSYQNTFYQALNLDLSLFNGGSDWAELRKAQTLAESAKIRLQDTEQQVILNGALAYIKLKLALDTLELNRKNVASLEAQYAHTSERLALQDVTHADHAQSLSRLSAAKSSYALAQAEVGQAEAEFFSITNQSVPYDELRPELLFSLPGTLEEAMAIARESNPQLQQKKYDEIAADYSEDAAIGALLPKVSLSATKATSRGNGSGGISERYDDDRITFNIRIPLYEGGATTARIRKATSVVQQATYNTLDLDRRLAQAIRSYWDLYKATLNANTTNYDAVQAAMKTLQSMQEEYRYGQRTLTDVLDAEGELFQNQIQWKRSEANVLVYAYQLQATMGLLTFDKLARLPESSEDSPASAPSENP